MNTRSPPSVTMNPIERPTSPYSASMSFYQAHKSAPSLGSFGTDVTYVEEAPTSQYPTTEKTKKGRRSRLRSFFRSKKSKGQPSPSSEADTPSAPEYPLEADPFGDYVGRPASPPLPSPTTMASCDTLVGSTPTGARKPRVLRKMHRPLQSTSQSRPTKTKSFCQARIPTTCQRALFVCPFLRFLCGRSKCART
ncbi:hypothetical protein BDZ89DRAFT_211541 [Hymenopellis radicata]|nr:hypothetical protein BDZ89DRAFT_211541 [Hymenopellis radicata]